MTKFLFLLLSVISLAPVAANAQIRRGTGLLHHSHGEVMFYARTITLSIKPEYREQFLQATHALQAQGAHEGGCLNYHYYEDPATRNNFLLLTEWNSAATMESHYRQQYAINYFEQLAHWLVEPAMIRDFETVKHQVTSIQAKP